ncbi:hypothetical protein BV25DRAFT_1871398 [Artomyces pyxidatus]|uniref:Uncharacterized protein n=1 Tax=Artomyces pyxidatus TaxID=48021 RepID=A0ACB8SU79_9AGAM|nr:hypothetical protein BV25DRAFT_1871398 [Artomyces pyxidatus]
MHSLSTPHLVVCISLLVSVAGNFFSAWRLRQEVSPGPIDDRHYTYKGDDYPVTLPLRLEDVALTYEEPANGEYGVSSSKAWSEWQSLDRFPHTGGFVRLGPEGRGFGISMFHQLHCLNIIRSAVLKGVPVHHTTHCFHLLRQAILCASDTTLDPLNMKDKPGTDGMGITHVCKDWTQVYDYVTTNQAAWQSAAYNLTE